MTVETVGNTDRERVSIWKKLNPLWWLVGPFGWTAPVMNNGAPYLPDVTNRFLRDFYWFCRNPFQNFVGFVLGVEDNNYTVTGPAPVLMTTLRDAVPVQYGWKWAVLTPTFSYPALLFSVIFCALTWFVHWGFAIPTFFAAVKTGGPLPFVSYSGPWIEAYLGWRPASGGFGAKLVPGGPK